MMIRGIAKLVSKWTLSVTFAIFLSPTLAHAQTEKPNDLPHTDVFVSGKGGYHTYRIPAIILTKKGTLLAFCEGRKSGRGDAGNIDLLVKRSTDLGKTWSDYDVLWDDGNNTCGNPTPVVDQTTGTIWLLLTWNHGQDHEREIHAGTSRDVRHVYVSSSTDDGQAWAKPKKISDQARRDHWRWYATGPGNAIQLTRGKYRGRLLIPCNHTDHSNPKVDAKRAHVIYSDDHGKTWHIGGVEEPKTNESAVVELADGRVLHSMRSYHGKHNRALAISKDGGESFGKVYLEDALQTPVCQGNILRYSWPDEKSGKPGVILASSPSGKGRTHMTVYASFDEGKTWPVRKVIYTGGSAYSNLVKLPNGTIGLLYEKDNYRTISFVTFGMDWVKGGE